MTTYSSSTSRNIATGRVRRAITTAHKGAGEASGQLPPTLVISPQTRIYTAFNFKLTLSWKKLANFVIPSDGTAIPCDNFVVPFRDQIRPLAGVPDHGFGLLGRLVHSVLAEYAGAPPPVMPARYAGSSFPLTFQHGFPPTVESLGVLGFWI